MRMQPAVGKKKKITSPSEGRNRQGSTGHQEVDLVPIMNLFVTIIPMLLTMVVLVSIAYISLDLSSPSASGAGSNSSDKKNDKKPEITSLELSINIENDIEFFAFTKNGQPDSAIEKIPADNYSKLTEVLKNYREVMWKDKYEDALILEEDDKFLSIIITPKEYVRFGTFVKTIDLCKKMKFTDIMLGEI